ncbi:MAG: helix-turn-helix domain-containing protein [Candidatus Dormibacteria bacterium]
MPSTDDELHIAGWLTTDEVAMIAGCSKETVIRAIHAGAITITKRTGGNTWLINRDHGIHWAKNYKPYDSLRKQE